MTMPNERTRAVMRTREFLLRLATPHRDDGIKRIPSAVREEASRLLRHYPGPNDMASFESSFDRGEAMKFFDEKEKF